MVTGKLDVREVAERLPEEAPSDIAEKSASEVDGVEHTDEEAEA